MEKASEEQEGFCNRRRGGYCMAERQELDNREQVNDSPYFTGPS